MSIFGDFPSIPNPPPKFGPLISVYKFFPDKELPLEPFPPKFALIPNPPDPDGTSGFLIPTLGAIAYEPPPVIRGAFLFILTEAFFFFESELLSLPLYIVAF